MLADQPDHLPGFGLLRGDIQKPATFRRELVEFIAGQLPAWRSCIDRKPETAEDALTSQLCIHLNSVSRLSQGWDILQFNREAPDEQQPSRKIDLIASPCGATIMIEGRRHTIFDSIMPIECKRLPTPKAKDRDEREYVFTQDGSKGGIQRFKAGHHGAAHAFGAMIGYVQKENARYWNNQIAGWITALADQVPGWSLNDLLRVESSDDSQQLAVLSSNSYPQWRPVRHRASAPLDQNDLVPGGPNFVTAPPPS